jgi:hypothetical protein
MITAPGRRGLGSAARTVSVRTASFAFPGTTSTAVMSRLSGSRLSCALSPRNGLSAALKPQRASGSSKLTPGRPRPPRWCAPAPAESAPLGPAH